MTSTPFFIRPDVTTKSPCHFHFIDEPKYRAQESRAHAAHLLRGYRANPRRYALTRCSLGVYMVVAVGNIAAALIETR